MINSILLKNPAKAGFFRWVHEFLSKNAYIHVPKPMRTLFNTLGLRGQDSFLKSSEGDLLTARGDQLHVISLVIVFVYSALFTVANFYFGNLVQAYLTIIPVPLSLLFYYFFRLGGRWVLLSKLGNLAVLLIVLSLLKLLDVPSSTGVLTFFIPVMVGAMITFQGKQRIYAWSCVGLALVLLGFLSLTDIHLYNQQPMSEAKLMQERFQNYVGAALVTAVQVGFLIWVSNQLQDRLLRNEQEKQRLATQLAIQSQEKQRNEVAIELHENINQILASAKLNLDRIEVDGRNKETVQETADHIEYALVEVKKLYQTLVTPDLQVFALSDLIRQMTDEFFAEDNISIEFNLQLDTQRPVPDEIKLSLYRIAQEHLQNVRMHAAASQLQVSLLEHSDSIHFSVQDDGVGFHVDTVRSGTGIRSMENRARLHNGTIEWVTAPGNGCTLRLILPLV